MTGEERQLQGLIDRRGADVATTTRKALAVMRKRYPGALRLVFENRNRLAVGFGPKLTQAVFSIVAGAVHPARCARVAAERSGRTPARR